MKKILLFTRRNVGLISLSYLVAKGHKVYVISDDIDVLWLALSLGVISRPHIKYIKDFGDFDIVLSVHWNKVIPVEYFNGKPAINIHPLLHLGDRYKGHNPVRKYIESNETVGGISAHYMTEIPDEGEIIATETFVTGNINDYASFYNIAFPFYYKCLSQVLNKINGSVY